jgi:hypothetical protein
VNQMPLEPVEFTLTTIESLTPFEQTHCMTDYACPKCKSHDVHFRDGDSVGVPVLPEGMPSYDHLDTLLMVGTCKTCSEPIFIYEFGFTTVANPDDDVIFCVTNLPQKPDRFQLYHAHAAGRDPWVVSRLFFDTGTLRDFPPEILRLPKGPFVVDYHQFGPYSLDHAGELSGPNGVARCGGAGASDKWKVGEALFQQLSASAMKCLTEAAAADTIRKNEQ